VCAGETFLSQLLLQRLCESFAGPVILWPLAAARSEEAADAAPPADRAWRQPAGSTGLVPTLLRFCLPHHGSYGSKCPRHTAWILTPNCNGAQP
jgi:hypothetical protein